LSNDSSQVWSECCLEEIHFEEVHHVGLVVTDKIPEDGC
jgi:hypothetical protein